MASVTQISTSTDLSALSGTKVTTTKTSTSSSSSTSTTKTSADDMKNRFLTILLTQMQHQNPMDPMDTKEFTSQLTQFSGLEQQIDTNTKLDSLIKSLGQSSLSSAFSYIGQYVDVATATSSVQDGAATWTYSLPKEAKSVRIQLTDASGNVVYDSPITTSSGNKTVASGTYNFSIDAANDLTKSVPNGGVLKMNIVATDSSGLTISPTVHTTVKVESAQSEADGTYLQAGGILFAMSDVQKIVPAPTGQNNNTTATETTTA